MRQLLISATENLVVELYENKKLINHAMPSNNQAEEMLALIKQVLKGKSIDSVDEILLNVGPGSFTGIRASMALVLGLVTRKNIKVVAYTSFDNFEYSKVTTQTILVVSGFSNFVYTKFIGGKEDNQMRCITISELCEFATFHNCEVWVANEELLNKLKKHNPNINVVVAGFSSNNVIKKHNDFALEKRNLEPVYLRASQAEIQRLERLITNGKKDTN